MDFAARSGSKFQKTVVTYVFFARHPSRMTAWLSLARETRKKNKPRRRSLVFRYGADMCVAVPAVKRGSSSIWIRDPFIFRVTLVCIRFAINPKNVEISVGIMKAMFSNNNKTCRTSMPTLNRSSCALTPFLRIWAWHNHRWYPCPFP